MAEFRPFNYSQAIAAGNQNALGAMQAKLMGEQLRSLPEERAYLKEQRKFQGQLNEMDRMLKGYKLLAEGAGSVYRAGGRGYDKFRINMEQLGIANPGELPEKPDLDMLKGLAGYAEDRVKKLVEIYDPSSPTRTRYVGVAEAVGKPGKPQKPLVEISNVGEKEESKKWGASLVKHFDKVDERAQAAEDSLMMLEAAKNIDVESGALEPMRAWASSIIESMGYNPESVGLNRAANAEAYQGIVQNLVIKKMGSIKGPATDDDARRLEQSVGTLGNTPAARRFLLEAATALEERAIEQRDFYLKYRQEKGTLNGVRRAWNEYKRKTPLLATNPNTGIPVFFSQFKREMVKANPGITEEEVLKIWREKYGNR